MCQIQSLGDIYLPICLLLRVDTVISRTMMRQWVSVPPQLGNLHHQGKGQAKQVMDWEGSEIRIRWRKLVMK